jgi:hypothetical protein
MPAAAVGQGQAGAVRPAAAAAASAAGDPATATAAAAARAAARTLGVVRVAALRRHHQAADDQRSHGEGLDVEGPLPAQPGRHHGAVAVADSRADGDGGEEEPQPQALRVTRHGCQSETRGGGGGRQGHSAYLVLRRCQVVEQRRGDALEGGLAHAAERARDQQHAVAGALAGQPGEHYGDAPQAQPPALQCRQGLQRGLSVDLIHILSQRAATFSQRTISLNGEQ